MFYGQEVLKSEILHYVISRISLYWSSLYQGLMQQRGVDDVLAFLKRFWRTRTWRWAARAEELFFFWTINCSMHPKDTTSLEYIKVEHLPTNTTTHLQPLDDGIIKNVAPFYCETVPGQCRARAAFDKQQNLKCCALFSNSMMHYPCS